MILEKDLNGESLVAEIDRIMNDEAKRKEVYKNLQQEIANQAYLYPIVDNQKS